MKKSGKAGPGAKVPSKGELTYSGPVKDCNSTVTAVSCSYTDNSHSLACIFPFIGENPAQKSGGSRHDSCLKTKRGVFWCATKVSQKNIKREFKSFILIKRLIKTTESSGPASRTET